jgi:DNA-binding NtrC family response regulator
LARVLVVDSNAAFAPPIERTLSGAGHQVAVAAGPVAALGRVRAERFDVLVTEAMPAGGMSGVRLVSELRALDPGLPIVITGAVDAHLELKALGPLALLRAPLPLAELRELVAVARRDALVALVEDDLMLADNLQEILAQAGFSTIHVASAKGVDALPMFPLVAAVVDLRLPDGRDGEALLKLAARYPRLPLIVASALDVKPPIQPLEYLYKPLDAGRLLGLIERLHQRG